MVDDAGSLAQRVSVRRQLEQPEETAPRPAQLPLRILYIVSRPADAGFIDPRLTAKALFDALDPLGGNVRVGHLCLQSRKALGERGVVMPVWPHAKGLDPPSSGASGFSTAPAFSEQS